jgi:hypothetical protein
MNLSVERVLRPQTGRLLRVRSRRCLVEDDEVLLCRCCGQISRWQRIVVSRNSQCEHKVGDSSECLRVRVVFSHARQVAVLAVMVFALMNVSGIWNSSALSFVSATIVGPTGVPSDFDVKSTSAWNEKPSLYGALNVATAASRSANESMSFGWNSRRYVVFAFGSVGRNSRKRDECVCCVRNTVVVDCERSR